MFGRLKRRWRRFQFYSQVHHPVFFRVVDFCKFPAQVALLAGTLWALVGWYSNFMQNRPVLTTGGEQSTTSLPTQTPSLAAARVTPATPSNSDTSVPSADPTKLNTSIIMRAGKTDPDGPSESVIPAPVVPVTIDAPDSQPRLLQTIQTSPSEAPPTLQPVAPPVVSQVAQAEPARRNAPIVGAEWVLAQNRGFVVQISTSTRPDRLRALAQQFGEIEPVALYPLARTAGNQQRYGLSVGYYSSYLAASEDFKLMPEEIRANEPWVRSVRTLQKTIQAIKTSGDSSLADIDKQLE